MNTKTLSKECIHAIKNGNMIFICGNGGSAAQAQHFAAELIGKYKFERRSLPCIALTTDTSALTAIANDYGYDYVFTRQLEGLSKKGDVLIGLSTSGKSRNVNNALKWGKRNGLVVCDFERFGDNTSYIQEGHIVELHELAGLIEQEFI
jgi:D-sedoheptulose 7-phosphate isomerase